MSPANGVWRVEVEVAMSRPPRADRTTYLTLSPEFDARDVELLAIAMAAGRRGVVMPVSSVITDWPEDDHLAGSA